MNTLALALSAAVLSAAPGPSMTGQEAPELTVSKWVSGPAVDLRSLRGRKVVLFLYHTAC